MTDPIEPGKVAVIGIAIRMPGAERDLDHFWRQVEAGAEAITVFDRADLLAWGAPAERVDHPRFVSAYGAPTDVECFDGELFGYSPLESSLIDLQQRALLECSWSALEHAGYPPLAADGNRIGVFVGTGESAYFYDNLLSNDKVLRTVGGMGLALANDKDFAATRISYKLNLQGPALTVQTACSTSLVAVHLAIQSLLTYDSDVALAGGARIVPPHQRGYMYAPRGIVSPDGHCRTFDAAAAGTVPGDGAGVVVLKRLEDAVRDNDTIHAVIVGSAINNDGSRKTGFIMPGVTGLTQVIASALAVADVDPDTVGMIEAHGTATLLGDPIEVAALRTVFGTGKPDRKPCALAALKPIVGHLDAAAGVAGLIKAVLALRHRVIPPVAHFSVANPALELDKSPFYVPIAAEPWEQIDGVRRAGVTSFAIGGTNVHVVLEEAPYGYPLIPMPSPRQLIMVSARTQEMAVESLARVVNHVNTLDVASVGDLAYTLRAGRAELPWRSAFVTGLDAVVRTPRQTDGQQNSGVVFAFTGDGAPHSGASSYAADQVFRSVVSDGASRLSTVAGVDLHSALLNPAQWDDPRLLAAARFVVAVGLAEALRTRGVSPAAVLGVGAGAIAAACTAGILSFSDGLDVTVGLQPHDSPNLCPAQVVVYSGIDGVRLTDEEAVDLDYWRAQLARQGEEGVGRALAQLDPPVWLSIGTDVTPHGVDAEGILPTAAALDGQTALLAIVGGLWEIGIGGAWDATHNAGHRRVPAPTYPFEAVRHYVDITDSPPATS